LKDPDALSRLIGILPKIRTPIQVSGLAITVVAVVATRIWVPGSAYTQIVTGLLGLLFLFFSQMFAYLDVISPNARASFLLKGLRTVLLFGMGYLVIFVAAEFLMSTRSLAHDQKAPDNRITYSTAEQRLIDIHSDLWVLRDKYRSLSKSSSKSSIQEVNRTADKLAERMNNVNDGDISTNYKILKYQHLAYAWAMVAGSESIPKARGEAAEKILNACDTARSLIESVNRASSTDKDAQYTRDWIIKDDAEARIQRLTAVALCVRWQVKPREREIDRLKVREIIENLPNHYLVNEEPEKSSELQPCLPATSKKAATLKAPH
jgi:hypothetical protein